MPTAITGQATGPSPLAEFNDVLHLPGHGSSVAASLAELLQTRDWSRLMLSGHKQDSVAAGMLHTLVNDHAEQVAKASRYVDLAGIGDRPFLSTLSGRAGTQARRNLREFEQRLGEITVQRAADPAQTLAFFAQMRELHLARWNSREKTTSLSADAVVAFHHRLIETLWPSGQVEMLRVGSADQPIGFLYNFIVHGKVAVFQTGFAYEVSSKWSPGMLTHALAIEHYRSRGLREYDFLSGDALYKRTLSNGSRDLLWTTVYRDRAWIRLLLLGRQLRRQLTPERGALEAA